MKSALKHLLIFACLTLTFSALTGCGSSAGTNAGGNAADNKAAGDKKAAPASGYPPLVSEIADAEIERIDGTKFKISERKGKVLLLNLWATWCGPCRAEMPHLVEMQDKYREKGFEVLGLDIGIPEENQMESVEEITAFAKKMKLNYELSRIPFELTAKFNKVAQFAGVPQTLLVDREGRLRGVFVGGGPNVISKMKTTVDSVMAEQ